MELYIEKKYHLYQVHWHQHARGRSLGGAMHDLHGESTNKTVGRVWIALYVKKKQLKVIFNIPRFTITYENMTFIKNVEISQNNCLLYLQLLNWSNII
jgi:hypothetical protein